MPQHRSRPSQARLRWLDSGPRDGSGAERDPEVGSISSEGAASGSDSGPRTRTRQRPREDVWARADVERALRALPGGEDILAMAESDDPDALLGHPHAPAVGLLVAAWRGDLGLLQKLLDANASPSAVDKDGRTALHLASCAGAGDCVELLLRSGAQVDAWDSQHWATPLHCAASAGSLESVRLLLRAGTDANAGLTGGRSALHFAVQNDASACVKELLTNGACPNTPQVFTEAPLHVAAAMGFATCTRLLLEHGADVRVQFGPGKITPLHLAAEDGNAECARMLLDAGAVLNATNNRLQTPLHLAALAQSAETLELLLQRRADPDVEDADGRTPLHSAIVKVCRSCECVRLLLDAGAEVNKADKFGYTPLHIAALNEFSHCVFLLLRYGADATARTNGGVSALSFIVRRTPDIIPRFQAQLDAAVQLHDHEIGDMDCELKLDFRILVPSVERGESGLLLAFIEVGHRHILKHPLCEAFLFLKWRRIRKFFISSLLFHALFVLLFSVYVVELFLCDRDSRAIVTIEVAGYTLLALTLLLLAKELFQMAHSWCGYVRHWENWLQWLIIFSAFLCAVPSLPFLGIDTTVQDWQHHVAAIGIFLTWLELMMLVGRFPMFGLYVQMFTTVAVNFAKFLLAYCCLLVAFSLSFGVLFPNYKPFKQVTLSLMKTVVMMSGELEFEDIFFGDNVVRYPVTAHLMFLAFVVLVTVILTNLLVGLAVSDIQGLQQSAGLDRLVRQAELVAHLESMLFSRLLYCLPAKLMTLCHRSALLLTSPYHWALYVRPNDPREHRAPREIVDAAYRLVAGRRDRTRRNRPTSNSGDKRATAMSDDYLLVKSNCTPLADDYNYVSSKTLLDVQVETVHEENVIRRRATEHTSSQIISQVNSLASQVQRLESTINKLVTNSREANN